MSDLKASLERYGFDNVKTYIQSGNVVLESAKGNLASVSARLKRCISEDFPEVDTLVVVKTGEQLKRIVRLAPREWTTRDDLRCYVALVSDPYSAGDLISKLRPKEGVDFLIPGDGVVYMSTLLSGLTKSGLSKVTSQEIYKAMTMRNFNTMKKMVALLESKPK
jgi:uncharacterized protein (DUF1697 family)